MSPMPLATKRAGSRTCKKRRLCSRSGFSRVPVIGDDVDDLIGVAYLKDAVRAMRRDELEGALSPLVSFKSIMHAAGQCSTDVDAGDVADVMDALLMNTFHRVGVPGVMGL